MIRHIILYSLLLTAAFACSRSGQADRELTRAESLMAERPDSALSILEGMDPEKIGSRRQRAEHALLLTQARDKNFRFETDDSLITTAAAYFDAHPVQPWQTLAHMYRGIVNLYRGSHTVAIKEALTALDLAAQLDDDYTLAKIHELIADIYVAVYNFEKAIPHRRLAADLYHAAGKTLNNQYALVELASAFNRVDKPDIAVAMLDSLSSEITDSTLLGFYHETYLKPLLKFNSYDAARRHSNLAERYWGEQTVDLQDRPYTSYLYLLLNQPDSAEHYLQLERKYNPHWNEMEEYHWAKSTILIKSRDYENAVAELEKMWAVHDKGLKEVLKHNVALAESDFHHDKAIAEHKRADKYHIIVWGISIATLIICVAFYIFYRERMKRKRLEIENKMLEVREITSRLVSSERKGTYLDTRLRDQRLLLNQLLRDRYMVLNHLSNKYFEKRDSEATRATIAKDFEDEIARIRQDNSIPRIKEIVDLCHDNILIRMRQQFPKFKEDDITFCALVIAGFSSRAICLLMDIERGNYYNKWTRIRRRITDSEAPDKELFLEVLNNHL
ncbi:hypothetical protein [uncultured Muribaculum sp.]|uniref:hypothetical protein n=1 Tax=uncultured Muribaculum sp. TaxID=1918613 RepID=UPI0025F62308|nr:hypothetical protein [uncultured Muribaculum sp.]